MRGKKKNVLWELALVLAVAILSGTGGIKVTAGSRIKGAAMRKEPVISGVKEIYATSPEKLTKGFLLKYVTVKQEGKRLPLKYITTGLEKIRKGAYRVTYRAQRSSLPAIAKTKAYIDRKPPSIQGIKDGRTYQADAAKKMNKAYARSLIKKVSDNYTKVKIADVAIMVKKLAGGTKYKARYVLKDAAGNKKVVAIYLVPVHFVMISGPPNVVIETTALGCDSNASTTHITSALRHYLLNQAGVMAKTYKNADLTDKMMLELVEKENDKYMAIFTVEDNKGHSARKTVKVTVKRKDFFAFHNASDLTVTDEVLGISLKDNRETVAGAVKAYVESLGIIATNLFDQAIVPAEVKKVTERNGKYLVTLAATDSKNHTQTKVIRVTVAFAEKSGW